MKERSALLVIIYIATLIHVYRYSLKMNDHPVRHTLLTALAVWPISYILWLWFRPKTAPRLFRRRRSNQSPGNVNFNTPRA